MDLAYISIMNSNRFQLRRWAAGLTIASLSFIGFALAPSSFADPDSNETGPCAFDPGSMACVEWESGGAGPDGPCGFNPGSLGCDEAEAAASGNGPVPPSAP